MTKLISEEAARGMLHRAIKRNKGQRNFSETHGVDQAVISLSLTGKRSISPSVARAIGLRKTTAYERIE